MFSEYKKPNLFIVGAPRCGTTSLHVSLRKHPDIFMSMVKEPHFFGHDVGGARRPAAPEYEALFSDWNDEKYAGESSVFYLYSNHAAAEIKAFNSAARIIILLRNPVDFLYSYHNHMRAIGFENIGDFEEAIEAESARKQGRMIPPKARKHRMEKTLYYSELAAFSNQVQRYLETFDRESVHIIVFDDLKTDPVRTYGDIFRFLGVDQDVETGPVVANASLKRIRNQTLLKCLTYGDHWVTGNSLPARTVRKRILQPLAEWNVQRGPQPPMPPPLRLRLQNEFASEVERLSKMLGRDLDHWTQSAANHRRSTNIEV